MSKALKALDRRLIRMESRLVQLMLHFQLDPYHQTYSTTPKLPADLQVEKPKET